MKQTTVQMLFIELEQKHPELFNVYTIKGKSFINDFYKYIEMEKQQIIDAFWNGDNTDCLKEQNAKEFAEQYYNKTYKNE